MKRIVALLLGLIFISNIPIGLAAEKQITQYLYGDREVPKIAITIDDWYSRELLPDFLDIAKENNCKLTLYPIGVNLLKEERDLWTRVVEEGHEIGNHTNTHLNLEKANKDRIIRQLKNMEKRLNDCLGEEYTINTLRYPFGAGRKKGTRSSFAKAVREAGYMHVVLWDIDTLDTRKILRNVENGSIILLHANKKDLRVFKEILPELTSRGFSMVTVSELLNLSKTTPIPDDGRN
ncbi:MAG: polysaccharide deacetylase family protein [Eubacteriales bacterium]|nr:polysaccharide deacetylase family protein [Eubacteriales bacterium]